MLRVVLTRHGQTEWNRMGRLRGRADIPLNEMGLAQAGAAAHRIHATWKPAAIYTSPMGRSVKTAEIIAAPLGLPVQILQELNDIDYGEWQGLTWLEVKEKWPDLCAAWYRNPELVQIPGGENLHSLRGRAERLIAFIAWQHQGETVVLVGHDSINRVILLHALGLPLHRYWNIEQENCAINLIEVGADDFIVVSMNETYHLVVGDRSARSREQC